MKVPLLNIVVNQEDKNKKRYRKDYGNIFELAESLKEFGLIHPVVVDQIDGSNQYRLIAGERRLRAAAYLGWEEVEVTLKSEVNDIQAKEMELEENIRRKDIDWEEQIEAVRQLNELKRAELGPSTRVKEGFGIKELAESIGASVGTASQDLKLATQLYDHPELRKKVKKLNKASARKLVNQVLDAEVLRDKMQKEGFEIGGVDFQHCPCEVGIKKLADNSVHCLITDPPFALDSIVGAATSGNTGLDFQYNIGGQNVGLEAELAKVYEILIPELYRVMVDGAHFYLFLGFGWYCRLVNMLRKQGFMVDDQPIIWYKERVSMPARGAHYMSSYEACLFGYKPPQNRVLLKSRPNVISIPAVNPAGRVHPLQKPFELLQIFIENSSSPGETVLDCFAGSAATLVTAKKLLRNSIGFEKDEGNFLRASEWIRKESQE